MFLPATFETNHDGATWTWQGHAHGTTARCDYIAVPMTWDNASLSTWNTHTIDTGATSIDHVPTLLHVVLCFHTTKTTSPIVSYDRKGLCDATLHQLASCMQDLPKIPWAFDVDSHAVALSEGISTSLARHYPAPKSKPRKSYISDATRHIRGQRIHIVKQYRQLKEESALMTLAASFSSWFHETSFVCHDLLIRGLICFFRLRRLQTQMRSDAKYLHKALRADRQAHLIQLAEQASHMPQREFHRTMQPLGVAGRQIKRGLRPLPILADVDGTILTSAEDVAERWRTFFGEQEDGHAVDLNELHLLHEADDAHKRCPPEWTDLPNLLELENQFHSTMPLRAMFEDHIPGEVLRNAAPFSAHKFYPLLLKIALSGKEPLIHKGGLLVAAFKQRGKQSECESYRSLMVSSGIAKAFHALYRRELVKPLRAFTLPLQIGGLPGMSIVHASQSLLAFAFAMRRRGHNVAILFLDVQQAFYRLLRQHMLEYSDERCFRSLFDALKLPAEAYAEFCALLNQNPALQQAQVSGHLRSIIAEFFRATWFMVPGSNVLTHTRRGSRPGDSLADVCYTFTLAKILKPLFDQVRCQPTTDLRWSGEHEPFPQHATQPLGPVCPIWADDLAIAFAHPDAEGVLHAAREVVGGLFDVLVPAGLQPNTKAQKTELLVDFRGKGKHTCMRNLMQNNMQIQICTKWGSPSLRVVDSYKHLGTWITTGGRLLLDMRTKFAHAHALITKYKGPIFGNKRFPLLKKTEMFNALVLSTITFNIAAWHVLAAVEMRHFANGMLRLHRRLAQLHFGIVAFHWTTHETFARLQLPMPEIILRVARLRYLQQLIRNGPDQLWGILQLDGTWWTLIAADLTWFRTTLPDFLPAPSLHQWETLRTFLEGPGARWKAALKRAIRSHVDYLTLQWKWTQWHNALLDTLIQSNLYVPANGDMTKGQHVCMPCQKRFQRAAAWAVHAFKCHGRIRQARRLACGTQCVACLKHYSSTVALVNHLTYSRHCLAATRNCGPPETVTPGLNSRAELRARRHMHLPYVQAQGPTQDPLPLPRDSDPDYDLCQPVWSATWQENMHQAIDHKVAELCKATSKLVVPFDRLPELLSQWTIECADNEETKLDVFAVSYRLQCMLHADTFAPRPPAQAEPKPHVDAVAAIASWPTDHRVRLCSIGRIRHCPVVVAHLFSGRRRPGDLQMHLEQWGGILQGAKVLSIDIIFHPTLGDMLNPETLRLFRRAIAEGVLHALVCGPPCETWTVARHSDDNGPRPLRSAISPAGLPGLLPKERRQLAIGNDLLGVAFTLFLDCLIHGAFMLLEHPEEAHGRPEIASIWRLDVTRLLTTFSNCMSAHVLQGHYGAPSAKPTRFLLANSTPDFEEIFLAHRCAVFPPQSVSIGKNTDGSWKTACLKEYPSALCRAMAHLIEVSLQNLTFDVHSERPAWFHDAIVDLCKDFDLKAQMGPDFAG